MEFEPYFALNDEAAGPILFLFPPGEGGAESYMNNIANSLPGIQLVLFNNIHLHTRMDSFESIAEYYLPLVRHLQPAGPYHFFGWSFGGVLALEISLQVLRAGESVSSLLLVDSFFNVRKAQADLGLSERENSLDPINHRYQPDEDALNELAEMADDIVLFKATEPVKTQQTAEQSRVFDYYARSSFNNLETLLPAEHFRVESLGKNDHFSWVFDELIVGSMSSRIRAIVGGNEAREFRVARRSDRRSPAIGSAVGAIEQR
jgi:N-(5-amino-5-carboxypentanoyl)-L-cysteinyl-D-valine synthase